MKKVVANSTYLRVPLLIHFWQPNKDFTFLQDKLETRLKGWRSKNLSWASHKTLIKSVAQALPIYAFSISDFPIGVCEKLDATTRKFWWNPKNRKKKKKKREKGRFLSWESWNHTCKPKDYGGLGYSLAKITWMVASKRNSPCINALRSKYKVSDDWLHKEPRKYASRSWKAIERMKPLIYKVACFLVGDGMSIDIWREPWVSWLPNFKPTPKDELTP
jgi:hypothetical protein